MLRGRERSRMRHLPYSVRSWHLSSVEVLRCTKHTDWILCRLLRVIVGIFGAKYHFFPRPFFVPTIQMTAHVLESLERKDAAAFAAACEPAWGEISPPASTAEIRPVKPTKTCEVRVYTGVARKWRSRDHAPCSSPVSDGYPNGHTHCHGQHTATLVVESLLTGRVFAAGLD